MKRLVAFVGAVMFVMSVAPSGAQEAQALSPLETLKVENARLKDMVITLSKRANACEAKQADSAITNEFAKLKQELESVRPGYTWDGEKFTKIPAKK